jgi:phospholipid/cholesterol/gamma-HCH transport system ATP-binding protein
MILLQRPDAGSIRVLGAELGTLIEADAQALRQRWGVMFQHGGLFGSLTVAENIGLPLREHSDLTERTIDELAAWKLALVGLPPEVGAQYPAELSGGMMKRASLARAMALDPELLFLDEPTAGLDPASAAGVDDLVRRLRALFGLTVVTITHDLDLLWQVADRVAVLADGRVQGLGTMAELSALDNPAVRPYFDGPRGRAAQQQEGRQAALRHAEPPGSAPSKTR